jgi:hypothetical protein
MAESIFYETFRFAQTTDRESAQSALLAMSRWLLVVAMREMGFPDEDYMK